MGNEGAPLRPSPILTVSLRPESSSFTMSSNKDSAKLNYMQKRRMISDIDSLVSEQQRNIIENEVDEVVKKNAIDNIRTLATFIFCKLS